MEWIDRLDREGWNFVIDELVWHLEEGRVLTAIAVTFAPISGVEFRFDNAEPVFFPIDRPHVREHWFAAVEIIRTFPELNSVCTQRAS